MYEKFKRKNKFLLKLNILFYSILKHIVSTQIKVFRIIFYLKENKEIIHIKDIYHISLI